MRYWYYRATRCQMSIHRQYSNSNWAAKLSAIRISYRGFMRFNIWHFPFGALLRYSFLCVNEFIVLLPFSPHTSSTQPIGHSMLSWHYIYRKIMFSFCMNAYRTTYQRLINDNFVQFDEAIWLSLFFLSWTQPVNKIQNLEFHLGRMNACHMCTGKNKWN